MEQVIVLPRVVTVLVCGASCTGKTTLARKINDTSPRASKALVSADDIMEQYAMLHPEAVPRMWYSIIRNDGMIRDSEYEKLLLQSYFGALNSSDLVIAEGIYVKQDAIISYILASARARGNAPFCLIKMNPGRDQHREFYAERSKRQKMNWGEIEKQLRYYEQVLSGNYSKIFPWVQQYTIDDPRNVKLQFLD